MPWVPELFSAPVLQRVEEKWQRELVSVPFFDGLMSGELDALAQSFAGEPEVHHPRAGASGEPACALEYNVVRWGRSELPPEAGVAVYVRGPSGKLAAARIYDDADPPLESLP